MATRNHGTANAPINDSMVNKPAGGLISAYTAQLISTSGSGTSINVTAPLPVNYQLELATNFDNPFNSPVQDMLGSRIGPAAGNIVTGVTSVSGRNKWMSSAVWQGGNLFRVVVPFVIVAKRSAANEVVRNMRELLKLVAPSEIAGDFLRAPGPNLNSVLSGEGGVSETTGEIIKIRLGDFFEMSPCVIESVVCDFDTQMDVNDRCPISVTITVSALSYWTTTREDLDDYFKPKLAPAYSGS